MTLTRTALIAISAYALAATAQAQEPAQEPAEVLTYCAPDSTAIRNEAYALHELGLITQYVLYSPPGFENAVHCYAATLAPDAYGIDGIEIEELLEGLGH